MIAVTTKLITVGIVFGTTTIDGDKDDHFVVLGGTIPTRDLFEGTETAPAEPADVIHLANVDTGRFHP